MIAVRKDLLVQRDLTLDAYTTIDEAIRDEKFELPASDEPVLLISDHGKLFELNLAGAFIWEKLQLRIDTKDIVDGLVHSFEVSRETAERDMDGFLRYLKKLRLAVDDSPSTREA